MTNSTGPDPLSSEERRAVLREHLEREKARRRTAEAKLAAITDACRSIPTPIAERILAIIGAEERQPAPRVAALEAALRRHTHTCTDSKGTVCGGCLEPAPCPDAALLGDQPHGRTTT